MKKISVGIIGSSRERHSLYLFEELTKQGAHAVLLDTAPDQPYPLSYDESRCHYDRCDLSGTDVFFLRALFLPTPAFEISRDVEKEGHIAYVAERERYAAWLSWLMSSPYQGRYIVNPVDTLLIHFAKPYQLERLRAAGIPVPKTLVTSDPEMVLDFSRDRAVVYKPVAGGALCRFLTEEDKLPERLEALSNAPVQFQEYIEGDDLRVFVLGKKVIASFLIKSESIDYRDGTHHVEPYELSPEVATLCIQACKALGLIFSGVDLKLRSDGSAVCIECNPSPMFEGFDRVAPNPIVSQLAAFLIEKAIQHR